MGALVSALVVGDVKIYFEHSKVLVLKDCYSIPNFTRNLISFGLLKRQGYYVSLYDPIFISINNKIICYGWKSNNLYFVQLKYCSFFCAIENLLIE